VAQSETVDPADLEQLVLGVSWSSGRPELDLRAVATGVRERRPLLDRPLGFEVRTPGRFCTGWYGFADGVGQLLPCPAGRRAVTSGQCEDCALRDQFRFAHQGHVGGYVPAALEPYLREPQWLYVATFADGFSKVGTAVEGRRQTRLDEQGPALAHYVARAADGRLVREAEDTVTRELELPQHRRGAAKAAAVAHPAPPDRVAARHAETVSQVVRLLAETVWGPGLDVVTAAWVPPGATGALRQPPPHGSWVEYPHDPTVGRHGLQVEACAGAVALARTEDGPDAVRYVVDLSRLKGVRLVPGSYRSPAAEVQEALF
jgi:hypothetical protein